MEISGNKATLFRIRVSLSDWLVAHLLLVRGTFLEVGTLLSKRKSLSGWPRLPNCRKPTVIMVLSIPLMVYF
jgi:hypothetical protein